MNGTNYNNDKKTTPKPLAGPASLGKRPAADIGKLDTLKPLKPLKDPMAPISPIKQTGAGKATNRATDALKGSIMKPKRK